MLKTFAVAAAGMVSVAVTLPSNNMEPYPAIESKSRLLWKTQLGSASFRSNVVFLGDRLYIGSNGDNFRDFGLIEPNSGVYALDRKTGKQVRHFAKELFGDMDVNGLLHHNNRLYFGNDNEEFLCTNLEGKIIWRNPTSGDIEHAPVLLKTKNGLGVVYAAESGEVKAVDPATGNIYWSYYIPGFDGWKPGNNRSLFKVRAWFDNGGAFFTAPLLVDLNQDGGDDLVYCLWGGSVLALDGRTGKQLWWIKDENTRFESVGVVGKGKEKFIVGLAYNYAGDYKYKGACVYYSLSGKELKKIPIEETTGGSGLNMLSLGDGNLLLNGRTHTYRIDGAGTIDPIDRSQPYLDTNYVRIETNYRNGFSPLFADRTITLANGKKAFVVMSQHDNGNYKFGFIEIVSIEDGAVLDRLSYPGGSEMPPVIQDVDRDGDLDILISSYDGYLYCYELPKY